VCGAREPALPIFELDDYRAALLAKLDTADGALGIMVGGTEGRTRAVTKAEKLNFTRRFCTIPSGGPLRLELRRVTLMPGKAPSRSVRRRSRRRQTAPACAAFSGGSRSTTG
jgi:hypothetical protein